MKILYILPFVIVNFFCLPSSGACEYQQWRYSFYPSSISEYSEYCQEESSSECSEGEANTCIDDPSHCYVIQTFYSGGECP